MPPARLFRGDTWRRAWVVGGLENPTNLTGATARLHLRDSKDILKIAATTENGLLSITPLLGRIDLRVEGTDMILDPNDSYTFDLELTTEDGIIRTIEQEKLKINADITRD
jgi:hypothetical protein